jgi:hypothetical protein
MKNNKYLIISLGLFMVCLISWQITGTIAGKSTKMDYITSISIYSFLVTAFFLFSTLILLLSLFLTR